MSKRENIEVNEASIELLTADITKAAPGYLDKTLLGIIITKGGCES